MAPTRQSRPDSGLGFRVKVLKTFEVIPASLGRAPHLLWFAASTASVYPLSGQAPTPASTWQSADRGKTLFSDFFFFFITLKPRVERYNVYEP